MMSIENTIENKRNRIRDYSSNYERNEEAVRNQLINPIFRALSWDPEDPEDVKHNLHTEDDFPDYTLFKDKKKRLVIEAKKLSVDIEKNEVMKQLGKYSFNEGIQYGIITNGLNWIFMKSFEWGIHYSERIVWKLDLERDSLASIIRKFSTISKENINNAELLVKKAEILEDTWISQIEQPNELVKELIEPFKSILKNTYPKYEFTDFEIEDFLSERFLEQFIDLVLVA